MSQANSVTISILGKQYTIACQQDEKAALIDAANYLDEQMRQIRENGKVVGMERIAVMAALNLSHDLLSSKSSSDSSSTNSSEHLKRANNKLDIALNRLKQLQI